MHPGREGRKWIVAHLGFLLRTAAAAAWPGAAAGDGAGDGAGAGAGAGAAAALACPGESCPGEFSLGSASPKGEAAAAQRGGGRLARLHSQREGVSGVTLIGRGGEAQGGGGEAGCRLLPPQADRGRGGAVGRWRVGLGGAREAWGGRRGLGLAIEGETAPLLPDCGGKGARVIPGLGPGFRQG